MRVAPYPTGVAHRSAGFVIMTVGSGMQLPPEAENELVTDLARLALEEAAPEELVLFPEAAEEYFKDPQAVLNPKRRDEPVGFGLDLAMLTPYVLAVATAVIRFLASTVADAVREESKPLVARLVRSVLRQPDSAPGLAGEASPLSADQARQVREIAYRRARDLGLDEDKAVLLADSVVGGLVLG
jgi:hypothetical protein